MMPILVKQHDITDCGAACIASVAAHHKLNLPIARIRQLASTDQKGTNVLGMVEAAQKLGFQAKGVKGTKESLFKIPKPSIAHIVVKKILHHYVVIYDISEKFITVMDPADGKIHKKTWEVFLEEWTGVLILLIPNDEFEVGNYKIRPAKRFWALLQPHKTVLIQAFFGALIFTLLGLCTSIYIQKITDFVLPEKNQNLLNLLSVGMILVILLQSSIGIIKSIFALKTGQRIDASLILGYYKHLLKLPQQFFDTMRVGEVISRVNDAVKIRTFINDIALNLVVNVLIVIFSFILMFAYYWKLALIMLVTIPIYAMVFYVNNQLNKRQQRTLMEKSANLESQLVESITRIATVNVLELNNLRTLPQKTALFLCLKQCIVPH